MSLGIVFMSTLTIPFSILKTSAIFVFSHLFPREYSLVFFNSKSWSPFLVCFIPWVFYSVICASLSKSFVCLICSLTNNFSTFLALVMNSCMFRKCLVILYFLYISKNTKTQKTTMTFFPPHLLHRIFTFLVPEMILVMNLSP